MAELTNVRSAAAAIDADLPAIARDVIRKHLDLDSQDTQDFLERPDSREQHQTMWHQWGIITHTRVFLRHFEADIPAFLREWGVWLPTDAALRRTIDGATRWDLLRIAIVLHDIGKFGARTRGRQRFHFTDHESLSGHIIRNELNLSHYGLSPEQVEYVARTAEDHFILGVIRKRAREVGRYDISFIDGPEFRALCNDIKIQHPDDFVEIGVLFLGDSLAKVDPSIGPELAVSQYQTNIEAARAYLVRVLAPPAEKDVHIMGGR